MDSFRNAAAPATPAIETDSETMKVSFKTNLARRADVPEPRRRTGSHIEQEILFQERNPQLAPYLAEMEGTYTRCQHRLPEDLDNVYLHIFRDCAWCREEFESLKKLKDSFR